MQCGDYFINPLLVAAIGEPLGSTFTVYLAGGHELRCACGTADRATDKRHQLADAVERAGKR